MLRFFSHYISSSLLRQMLADMLVMMLAIGAGIAISGRVAVAMTGELVWASLPLFVMAMVMIGALGLYHHVPGRSITSVVARVVAAFLVALPIVYVSAPFFVEVEQARTVLQNIWMAGLAGVAVERILAAKGWLGGVSSVRKVLVLGVGEDARSVEQAVRASPELGYLIVGFYPVHPAEPRVVNKQRILPTHTPLFELADQLRVDEVIVALRERRGGVLPLNQLLDCKTAGIQVTELSNFFERIRGQVRLDSLRASWLIYGEGFRQSPWRVGVKRGFDIIASLVLLVVTLPVAAVTALAIFAETGLPVFYRQERVGQAGRTFEVLKFRSMVTDAERDGKPRWARKNDSRVTQVGRFIRRTRIDELPQIWNVLRGDMSFVGPRPERPYFVDQLSTQIPFFAVRHCVKPGVTGWAQVKYTYGSTVEDAVQKLQFDLYYVKNHTLFLDMVIILHTIRVVLSGQGAH